MRKPSPLVSIGLVTYNRGSILHLAIEQLLAQSYKNIELIISDNASTDDTQKVVLRYAKKDSRIRYIRQKNNIGMYNNFNFVLSQAQGEFFLWATDDDEWNPDFIKRMLVLFHTYPEAVVATSNYVLFSDKEREITHYSYRPISTPPDSVRVFLYHAVFITYGLVRIEVVRRAGGFFRYPWPIPDGIGDTVSIFRVLLQGGVAFDRKVLWKKRDSGYSFERFAIFSALTFNKAILMRLRRYLLFPILYIYNLFFMLKEVTGSLLTLRSKSEASILVFTFFGQNIFEYIRLVLYGCYVVIKSFIRKARTTTSHT